MIKNKSFLRNSKISILITIVCFLLFSFCSALLYAQTTNYKIDHLAYNINDYNKHYYGNNTKRPFVKINKRDSHQLYNDLFSQFYYSDDSGSVRQYMDNDCVFFTDDGVINEKVTLYSQSTFSIANSEAKDGGYRIDYGLFHSYFSDPNKSYLGIRFGCDSYVFISDTFADILVDYYDLPSSEEAKIESYKKLISEERYAVLKVKIDNDTVVRLSISNIVYSSKRTGPRCLEFNNYFGLISFPYLSNLLKPCFEIDFKTYAYYITSVLFKTDRLGYNRDNSEFSFFIYNYDDKLYELNNSVTDAFTKIDFSGKTSVVFSTLFYVSLLLFSLSFFFILKIFIYKRKDTIICLLSMFLLLTLYSILANFIYICFAFSAMPLLLFIICILMKGGYTLGFKKYNSKNKKLFFDESNFTEIKV